MDLKELECVAVERNHLTQDQVKWCALVNTVMNLRGLLKNGRNFGAAEQLLASKEWLSSIQILVGIMTKLWIV
jgi:hypothetical protein